MRESESEVSEFTIGPGSVFFFFFVDIGKDAKLGDAGKPVFRLGSSSDRPSDVEFVSPADFPRISLAGDKGERRLLDLANVSISESVPDSLPGVLRFLTGLSF